VIGPALLLIGFTTAGAFAGGWAGAVAGGVVALAFVGAVAAAALAWANTIGRRIDPEDAWETAPRPPLFGGLCEAMYRRVLGPDLLENGQEES
jgi:hypothetical protein